MEKKMVKVKILMNMRDYEIGKEYEVEESVADFMCMTSKLENGVSPRRAIRVSEIKENDGKDPAKMTVGEMAAANLKNIVETPASEAEAISSKKQEPPVDAASDAPAPKKKTK